MEAKEPNPQQIWILDERDAEVFAEALMEKPSIGIRLAAAARLYKEEFLSTPAAEDEESQPRFS